MAAEPDRGSRWLMMRRATQWTSPRLERPPGRAAAAARRLAHLQRRQDHEPRLPQRPCRMEPTSSARQRHLRRACRRQTPRAAPAGQRLARGAIVVMMLIVSAGLDSCRSPEALPPRLGPDFGSRYSPGRGAVTKVYVKKTMRCSRAAPVDIDQSSSDALNAALGLRVGASSVNASTSSVQQPGHRCGGRGKRRLAHRSRAVGKDNKEDPGAVSLRGSERASTGSRPESGGETKRTCSARRTRQA